MKRTIPASLVALALSASGCATTPEPCTSEWVHWKTDRFVSEFVRDHQKEFGNARSSAALLSGSAGIDTSAGIPTMILAAAGMLTLASDFMEDLWPDVRDAMSECDTAPKATQLFASILREQGVDERAAKAVEDLGLLLDRRG
ncbi:MAG: hypothetical protein ABL956_12410 [Hyphomonadaceae bacterium]